MDQPILSIDVSKSNSYATAFLAYGQPFNSPTSFSNTTKGISIAFKLLKNLKKASGKQPRVVLESTGNFSKPLKYSFMKGGYEVIELNPIQTHKEKKRNIRKIKTDPIDTHRIAQVYYLNNFKPQANIPEETAELKNLTRQYESFNELHRETQLKFMSLVDLIFPQYNEVFAKLCSITSLKVLSAFSTPDAILNADINQLKSILKISNHNQKWIDNKVKELMAAAKESLSYKVAQSSSIRFLKHYIELLFTQKAILKDLKTEITKYAKLSYAFPLLLSIPGVGKLTAASIIGEIGDIHRFPTTKQLTAYAGLDPSVYQSGRFKATNNKISKRGSTYLRKSLYQATTAAVRKVKVRPNNQLLYDYYNQKREQGKPYKVAIIATANKLLRTIYGVWKNNEMFKIK
jgi:transposase